MYEQGLVQSRICTNLRNEDKAKCDGDGNNNEERGDDVTADEILVVDEETNGNSHHTDDRQVVHRHADVPTTREWGT